FDPVSSADKGAHPGPVLRQARSDRRGPCDPKTGTGVAGQTLKRLLQNVCDDLHPDAALCASIRDDEPFRLMTDVTEYIDMMTDGVGVGLAHGAPKVPDI